jgi:hypothetical protein
MENPPHILRVFCHVFAGILTSLYHIFQKLQPLSAFTGKGVFHDTIFFSQTGRWAGAGGGTLVGKPISASHRPTFFAGRASGCDC